MIPRTRHRSLKINSICSLTKRLRTQTAHIRKTNPRNNLKPKDTESSSIVRAGIPYGEGSEEEKKHTTLIDRGLAFVAYQGSIENGWSYFLSAWANDPDFPHGKDRSPDATLPGFDAIIGQRAGKDRERPGIHGVKLPKDFVVPRAGAYFFVPSIPALHEFFAKAFAIKYSKCSYDFWLLIDSTYMVYDKETVEK
ncbi:Dyp-type peroxidase [Rhizoctonia solani 123E]|uniref:Dyp-type peroxidase n=1 Tax=Rhizoctonia solani 123E TaxID=1423351 RepID=A0A074SCC6_9AGAM|nr:Dyp-type peroxidase [Rhizoctonia solani 123E]